MELVLLCFSMQLQLFVPETQKGPSPEKADIVVAETPEGPTDAEMPVEAKNECEASTSAAAK